MKYVISYDISNNKRRTKLADLLGAYGVRVNYSVFECELNQVKLDKLLYEIELKKLINKKYDSLRFYHLCENCVPKSFDVGNREDPFEPISCELF
ncbi:MAG TPA: CRISPR-associated endonuclease Cas2 [Arcobacter sp.]|jgi:CRISPR-associated protein Cas2|nr:CRISPR-associated endonuclease Cas2 [Arcobacter sp.]